MVGYRDAAAVRAGTGTKCARFRGGITKSAGVAFLRIVPISLLQFIVDVQWVVGSS